MPMVKIKGKYGTGRPSSSEVSMRSANPKGYYGSTLKDYSTGYRKMKEDKVKSDEGNYSKSAYEGATM